ncbi:MAG: cyclase family protein [Candidatus Abyssobacteria bacterium SURF_17]|uniref:Kynurenine formamidase n=1 Tax=Candidatus Abyssobacteria bacterium SURF_17 TaxID=2093361 RepID=A0A419EZT6_9BACT|nr:MAG: cyclase family protein [Candidatus Abyssubacteria bacterium SURF_17]
MKYYDVSVPITAGMPVYEGDPPVEIPRLSSIVHGDLANVSQLVMGAHTGTHVDAPLHFIEGGRAIDEIPLDVLIGPALVVEFNKGTEGISREALIASHCEGQQRVLLKTLNSSLWQAREFRKDFVYLTADASRYLVETGVKLVGIDYLSIERFGAAEPCAHRALLGAGMVILEGLNLSDIRPGRYQLICLPLRIKGGDGSPCRVVLIEE